MSSFEKEVVAICSSYGIQLQPGYRKDALLALYEYISSPEAVAEAGLEVDRCIYDNARLILQLECAQEGFAVSVERMSASYGQEFRQYLQAGLNEQLRRACFVMELSAAGYAKDSLLAQHSLAIPCQGDKSKCLFVKLTDEERQYISQNDKLPMSAVEKVVQIADDAKARAKALKGRSSYNALMGIWASQIMSSLQLLLMESKESQPDFSQIELLNITADFMHQSGLLTNIKGERWVHMFMYVNNKDGVVDGEVRKRRADAVKSWIKAAEKSE